MNLSFPSVVKTIVLSGLAVGLFGTAPSQAATLKIMPDAPQPGDVLTLTVYPSAGEKIKAIGMAGFDTPIVKFYARSDGSARAFLGFPFDRTGGTSTLRARVQMERGGQEMEQTVTAQMRARSRNFPTQYVTMQGSTASKMNQKGDLHQEKLLVQSTMQHSNATPLWRGSWLVPTPGRSTSSYGRKRYVNGKWWGQHNGADIKASTGAPVMATNNGRVVLSQYLPTLRGNCIVLDHGCNVFSVYMHLSQRIAQVGQTVARGQLIGRVGATGFVTGPHLHWEIRIGWEPVDPFKVAQSGLQF